MSKIYKLLALISVCTVIVLLPAGETEQEPARAPERPNIIFIVVDDLDTGSAYRMRRLRSLMIDEGVTFRNAFVTDPLCCPSRATILRGQYAHNHGVISNHWPTGGYARFHSLGLEDSTVATWMRSAGYRTALVGKYLNEYKVADVPPGWDRWYGLLTPAGYYDSQLNENGVIVSYKGERNYSTDVLADKAVGFVRRSGGEGRPFFMYLAPKAPHQGHAAPRAPRKPNLPTPRRKVSFEGVRAPRPPSFDEEDVSDKPAWVRDKPRLSREQTSFIDKLYRQRLRSMVAVNDMTGRLIDALAQTRELDNTYVFFTSDNGWHQGQHRLIPGKWTAYEEDIRVPLIVRGPGVPAGQTREHFVLNNDLAPTFAELAGRGVPEFVDGRSLGSLLTDKLPPQAGWRSSFLVEAEAHAKSDRPAYEALRTGHHLYVEYESGERELYDMRDDPYQLQSKHETASADLLERLSSRLDALRTCAGAGCRAAEDAPPP